MDNSQLQTQQFLGTIKDLETRVGNLEKTPQSQTIDWYEWNPSLFSYSASNIIKVDSSIAISNFFAAGDRLRLIQSQVTKYFFIIFTDTTSNLLYVHGGDTCSYTNNTITEIATSKLPLPSGFPSYISFTPVIYKWSSPAGFFVPDGNKICYYTMSGKHVTLNYMISGGNFPAMNEFDIYMPFINNPANDYLSGSSVSGGLTVVDGTNLIFANFYAKLTGMTADYAVIVRTVTSTAFTAGINSFVGSINFVI